MRKQNTQMFLLNAFSLNMLSGFPASVQFSEISLKEAARLAAECTSAVGHANTAAVFSSELGVEVQANRANVTLSSGDQALVGQYRGPRLAEGATSLPEDATIVWLLVTVS